MFCNVNISETVDFVESIDFLMKVSVTKTYFVREELV